MTSFIGESAIIGNKTIYGKAQINGEIVKIGDIIYYYHRSGQSQISDYYTAIRESAKKSLTTRSGNIFIGQVLYFYETRETKTKCVHLKNLVRKTNIFRTKDDDVKRKKAKNFGIELFDSLYVCYKLEVSRIVSVTLTVTILELNETFP